MSAPAILAESVSKSFRRRHRPRESSGWWRRFFKAREEAETFWALREVSFEVGSGSMVGVLGGNGAGKSTLLRLLGGVGRPDLGVIRTRGRIRALLDLGSGMHPELTGLENTFLIGAVAGLTRREVRNRLDAIVAFAGIEEFIDDPLRTYSTGMQMRLAFSIAVHTDPEILLVDEVLAVGDLGFQRKCLDCIRTIKEQGCAILFVSHDTVTVRQLCDQALWLRQGRLVACGAAEVVAGQYVAEMSVETRRRMPFLAAHEAPEPGSGLRLGVNRFGSLEMKLCGVTILNRFGRPTQEIESGDPLTVEIRYDAPSPIESPVFNVSLSNEERQDIFDVNTDGKGSTLPRLHGQGTLSLQISRLDLRPGQYYLNVGVYQAAWSHAYDYHWHIYELTINSPVRQFGLLHSPHVWTLKPAEADPKTGPIQARRTSSGEFPSHP